MSVSQQATAVYKLPFRYCGRESTQIGEPEAEARKSSERSFRSPGVLTDLFGHFSTLTR